jgi:hypothetical protein
VLASEPCLPQRQPGRQTPHGIGKLIEFTTWLDGLDGRTCKGALFLLDLTVTGNTSSFGILHYARPGIRSLLLAGTCVFVLRHPGDIDPLSLSLDGLDWYRTAARPKLESLCKT